MPGDIGAGDPHIIQKTAEPADEIRKRAACRQPFAAAMTRHVDRNDAMRVGKSLDLRLPGFKPHADAVDEDQVLAGTRFKIGRPTLCRLARERGSTCLCNIDP